MGYCWSESSPGCKIKIHIDMITQYETWNGYAVHGDVKELDAIVESTGFIELDKEDVVSILSADGENCVISGTGNEMDEAFNNAIDSLPSSIDKVNNLLIDFRYGDRPPKMAELSKISSSLSEASPTIEIRWGISNDESLGDTCKVVLVASINH